MTSKRDAQLAALRQDLERLGREARTLAGNARGRARLAGEEAVGAELLAGRDLVAHLGMVWSTLERFQDLSLRQARLLLEDHRATWESLLSGPRPGDLGGVMSDHFGRRARHLSEGVTQGLEVLSSQRAEACESLARIWAPFLAIVASEWTPGNRDRRGRR